MRKTQRKVSSIRFKILKKNEKFLLITNEKNELTQKLIKSWGFNIMQAEQLLFHHGINNVKLKLEEIEKQKTKIKDKRLYLLGCFKGNTIKLSSKKRTKLQIFFQNQKKRQF